MPLYEYRCAQCGPFDHRRVPEEANAPLPCPRCGAPARRVYTAPATPSRSGPRGGGGAGGRGRGVPGRGGGPLAGAGAADRARVDRALSGEPVVTGRPQGRPLPSRGHPH